MKIFDTHTHVYPDRIASAVVAHLREKSRGIPAFTDGTYQDHLEKCSQAGYMGWMNCPVVTRPGQAQHTNQWAAEHNHWPSLSLGSIHPDDTDFAGLLERVQELGLHGLKFHPEYQSFSLLERKMEPIWDLLENRGVKLLFHGGEDIGFTAPFHSDIREFVEFSHRHPGLNFIVGHLGGWNQWNQVEELIGEAASNLYLDTSFALPFMQDHSQMTRIIRGCGSDHVLFGTDSPWQDLEEARRWFLELDLTPDEQESVLWSNAEKFWGFQEVAKQ